MSSEVPRTCGRVSVSSHYLLDEDHKSREGNLEEELSYKGNTGNVDSDLGHEESDILVTDGSHQDVEERFHLNKVIISVLSFPIHYIYLPCCSKGCVSSVVSDSVCVGSC